MSKQYYRKAKTSKEKILAGLCKVLNGITGTKKYGLTKGWDIAQIVLNSDYEKLMKKEGVFIHPDGVIEINEAE